MILYKQSIETPLGDMVTYASEKGICLLEFYDRKGFDKQINSTLRTFNNEVLNETNQHIELLRKELKEYFNSETKQFTVALDMIGTDFQQKVWNELLKIPYGKTISYKQQAINIEAPLSVRAVANANGKNKLSIIIPCHRVIGSNGLLTGYAGGVDRKKFLLDLEGSI